MGLVPYFTHDATRYAASCLIAADLHNGACVHCHLHGCFVALFFSEGVGAASLALWMTGSGGWRSNVRRAGSLYDLPLVLSEKRTRTAATEGAPDATRALAGAYPSVRGISSEQEMSAHDLIRGSSPRPEPKERSIMVPNADAPIEHVPSRLTSQDRCDACGAQAYIAATVNGSELLYCAHHGRRFAPRLRPLASRWTDETQRLGT